jgi:hypothetical protein
MNDKLLVIHRDALRAEEVIEQACAHVTRNFTAEEWHRYLPDEKYSGNRPCPKMASF